MFSRFSIPEAGKRLKHAGQRALRKRVGEHRRMSYGYDMYNMTELQGVNTVFLN